ncbi:meiotic nuclear division protein 1 homolog [Dysidea avara]|uniref:meiotic nuclear division protein 1 homolog n=1 Tax=Dysidea avara TaxID=196820 RepID=UPI0033276253
MSKKRGLSLEEKRTKLMELFFEKKDFFQLKELEKIAPKEKGITSMSVKEVLQSLVDDDMVDSERIGTSTYFWAFPSKASMKRKRRLSDLNEQLVHSEKKIAALDGDIKSASEGREDSTDRLAMLTKLEDVTSRRQQLSTELEKYKNCDPERLKEIRKETTVAMDAANRWTENVFSLKSWCKNKFGFLESDIDKQFGIPEDFDYLN